MGRRRVLTVTLVSVIAATLFPVAPSQAVPGPQANGASTEASISANGRYVVFTSTATNLVSASDTNSATDVFVRDRTDGATILVSVRNGGGAGTGTSDSPFISADGRHVAFRSSAEDLVSGDSNGNYDIFVRDLASGTTTRVSRSSSGAQANGTNREPVLSADGRFVAFRSRATNLVSGDTNAEDDIFVHDRSTGATERVSVSSSGTQGNDASEEPSISADGRYVAFRSHATNLVSGDTNNWDDIFVRDRSTGQTFRVNVSSSGAQTEKFTHGRPWISGQGTFVAYSSDSTILVPNDSNGTEDAFRRDIPRSITERSSVSSSGGQSNGATDDVSISSDGRFVAFHSLATNLVGGDNNSQRDVFLRDHSGGTTIRVSVDSAENEANGLSEVAQVSGGGGYVVFQSFASNLVANDTNGANDVFVRDLSAGTTERVSVGNNAAPVVSLTVSPTDGDNTTVFTADMAGTSDPEGDPITYRIDWGDGTVTNASSGTHSYSSRGTYTITATATDQWGASGSKTRAVNVSNNPPNATFTVSPEQGDTQTTFTADLSATDPDGDPVTYRIDWGDGTVTDSNHDTHQYSATGEYVVVGSAFDNVGGVNSIERTVRVCDAIVNGNCVSREPEEPDAFTLCNEPTCEQVESEYQGTSNSAGDTAATACETGEAVCGAAALGAATLTEAIPDTNLMGELGAEPSLTVLTANVMQSSANEQNTKCDDLSPGQNGYTDEKDCEPEEREKRFARRVNVLWKRMKAEGPDGLDRNAPAIILLQEVRNVDLEGEQGIVGRLNNQFQGQNYKIANVLSGSTTKVGDLPSANAEIHADTAIIYAKHQVEQRAQDSQMGSDQKYIQTTYTENDREKGPGSPGKVKYKRHAIASFKQKHSSRTIAVASVHLVPDDHIKDSEESRLYTRWAKELSGTLESRYGTVNRFVIAGDFNHQRCRSGGYPEPIDCTTRTWYKALRDRDGDGVPTDYVDSIFKAHGSSQGKLDRQYQDGESHRGRRIDFIWGKGFPGVERSSYDLTCGAGWTADRDTCDRLINPQRYSDHRLVWAIFRMKPR